MRFLTAVLLLSFVVVDATAGMFDTKNPDVPAGGVAIDFLANVSVQGSLEDSAWHLIEFVPTGSGLIADGLTVESKANLSTRDVGVSLMTALSPRVTAQFHYRYSRLTVDDVEYTGAGALSPPDLRLSPPYETRTDHHAIGIRLRVWLGTD